MPTRVAEDRTAVAKMTGMTETFDHSVYQRRLDQARETLTKRHLAGVIIGTGPELAYLTGSWISSHERFTALVIAADGTARLVAPGVDKGELGRSPVGQMDIDIAGWADGEDPYALATDIFGGGVTGQVGIGSSITADHLFKLREKLPSAQFVLATTVLKELFMRKDPEEIEWLRTAGQAIDQVFYKVPELLVAGRTEREVAADIEKLILEGHDVVDFIIVGSGPNGANPHHDFSDRVLEKGDVVVVDLGGTVGPGYHSDCTRTFVVPGAEPSADYQKFIPVLQRAQEEAVKAIMPGVTAEHIDAVARDIIAEAGYGDAYFHRTGHGIGLSEHEDPFIIADNDMPLEEGMTFSVEPGIYLEGNVGARIEDIVVVTADGCERLNNTPRS
ncbi:Creatinase/Prolidase N-terminal domain-containing protein [Corynebacterium glucuronolyticum]|nr:Xaa-Pro dipeptidase [Corynebacterium glucuronolyticum DSM 44120]SMB81335.1 Creatinase/Prolidase N-terminal domain-containing protein [Corynebacterium glucuronolyticum]